MPCKEGIDMKVYLDIFFLVNAGMNFVVFMIESFFQNRKVHVLRLLLTAVLGAIAAILFLISGIHRFWWFSTPVYVIGSGVHVRYAFGKTTVFAWIKNLIIYYVSSFLLSGLLAHMQQALGKGQGNSVFLIWATGLALVIFYHFVPKVQKWQKKSRQYITFRLVYGEKSVSGKGLVDTGNHLKDPFSGQPVSVGEKQFLTKLLEETPIYRYIPYHSLGNNQGMIPAFQASYIEFKVEEKWQRIEKPWIAISNEKISADGEYELILQPDMCINK